MNPHYTDDAEAVTLYHGDCRDVLAALPDASVDSVVTDPPYELGFMGRKWDAQGIAYSVAMWGEVLRVLKPGGHLLAFGGTRTWHRMVCAIEDAGFEVRDSLQWLYGAGFPKSLNVAKDDRFCHCPWGESDGGRVPTPERELRPLRANDVPQAVNAGDERGQVLFSGLPQPGSSGHGSMSVQGSADGGEPGVEGWRDLPAGQGQLHRTPVREVPARVHVDGPEGRVHHGASACDGSPVGSVALAVGSGEPHRPQPSEQRSGELGAVPQQRGSQARRGRPVCAGCGKPVVTGWGTALKPAVEPICLARRPLTGTVAGNVLEWGTGALNIDACRIATNDGYESNAVTQGVNTARTSWEHRQQPRTFEPSASGRWPANVLLDEDAAALLDQQSGETSYNPPGVHGQQRGDQRPDTDAAFAIRKDGDGVDGYGDRGGASRFFYVAKAPQHERPRLEDGTAHPTVKPVELIRWLVRLITPPGGLVLDPFAGTGTTAEAALIEGMRCVLIEAEADHLPLIIQRLTKPIQPTLI